jgi:hypothetical protein
MDSRSLLASIKHQLRMFTVFQCKVGIFWFQGDGIVMSSFGKLMEIN